MDGEPIAYMQSTIDGALYVVGPDGWPEEFNPCDHLGRGLGVPVIDVDPSSVVDTEQRRELEC